MLAACSPSPDADRDRVQVPCGRGAGPLADRCSVETSAVGRGTVLTLRVVDGGFRRLLVVRDGRGIVAADGAEPAVVTPAGRGTIDVRIGDDRYRLSSPVAGAPR